MFTPSLLSLAKDVLDTARQKKLRLATAESCTGGLMAGLLTEIPGSSDVFERGFVVYSNQAKLDLLGVPARLLAEFGAVSEEVAVVMATGAVEHSLRTFPSRSPASPDRAAVRETSRLVWFTLPSTAKATAQRTKCITSAMSGAPKCA